MPQKIWLLSLFILTTGLSPVMAQDYTPPPMFDAPAPLPPANSTEEKPRELGLPKRSKPAAMAPKLQQKEPSIAQNEPKNVKLETANAPVPSKKPEQPVEKIIKPKPNKGVVKGPKTMPSVPAQGYDSETVFKDEDGVLEGAILKRHTKVPVNVGAPESKPNISIEDLDKLSVFELDSGKAQKITSLFDQGQADIDPSILSVMSLKSLNILSQNPDWRIQIMSYASAYDQGQSSDRRMSLNRALSVRDALLEQDIEARIIDVRALGDAAQTPPKDRIDLILYAPDANPETVK